MCAGSTQALLMPGRYTWLFCILARPWVVSICICMGTTDASFFSFLAPASAAAAIAIPPALPGDVDAPNDAAVPPAELGVLGKSWVPASGRRPAGTAVVEACLDPALLPSTWMVGGLPSRAAFSARWRSCTVRFRERKSIVDERFDGGLFRERVRARVVTDAPEVRCVPSGSSLWQACQGLSLF